MPDYDAFIARVKELSTIESIGGLLAWDQETMMPSKGGALRAESLAFLSGLAHSRLVDPAMGELLEKLEDADVDEGQAANVREVRHAYDKATKLPAELVEEIARHKSQSLQVWQEARAEDDFSKFQPALEKMVDLQCQAAEHYGYEDNIYDAMLDNYEQGMTVAQLDPLFAGLREEIVPLVKAVGESDQPDISFMERGSFPEAGQREFSLRVAAAIGFDFDAGRMDTSTHPFCSGAGPRDVRFTTRYDESFPFGCLYGVMHETGHGLYEQGLLPEHEGTPLGKAVSLGVHESQSRLWENLVGRSREFWEYWLPDFCETFPHVGDLDLDTIHRAVNRVHPSLIRVEADEATYNLHIMLRYEVEKALVNGEVAVGDLPQFWNSRMEKYLGIIPPNDAQGVLQDIHWSMGAIGYFPTYSLGNLYAAQLWEATLRDLPDLSQQIAAGKTASLLEWMRSHIHVHGSRWEPEELVQRASGAEPGAEAFVRYLKAKFGALYGLA
jgi:carboxypeptidase Taq